MNRPIWAVPAALLFLSFSLPVGARGQTPPNVDALASRGLAPAFAPTAGQPSVIVVHGHEPNPEDFKNLIEALKKKGYNLYLYTYQKEMIPATTAKAFTASNLETYIESLEDLPEASSGLADAAKYLFGETHETTVNIIGFSLGGVIARGSSVFFPDHPDQHTLASNDPNAPRVNIVTVDSPLSGMTGMKGRGPAAGAFFSGVFPNFYSPFRDSTMWYLNGKTGPNVHHQLGSSKDDDVVRVDGQQLPNGMKPESTFNLRGTHVESISLPDNVEKIVDTLEELNGRRVSMAPSSGHRSEVELLAFVGAEYAAFGNAVDSACTVITGRYATAAYNQSSCSGSASANGFEAGGGVSLPISGALSIEATAGFEGFGDLAVVTTGTRTNGNLRFDATSETRFRIFSVSAGPSFALGTRLRLTPVVKLVRWHSSETFVDSLLAGIPQAQVQGGTTTTENSGTSLGVGGRVRFAVAGPLNAYAEFDHASLGSVFPANGKAGWPEDIALNELKVGAMFAF